MSYFQRVQKEFGYKETGNLLLLQWDMRVIIEHIDDDQELANLIRFYVITSDDKSIEGFKREYTDYLEAMQRKRADLARIEYLQRQTLEKRKKRHDQVES